MLADLGKHDKEEEKDFKRSSKELQEIVDIEKNENSQGLQVKGMY